MSCDVWFILQGNRFVRLSCWQLLRIAGRPFRSLFVWLHPFYFLQYTSCGKDPNRVFQPFDVPPFAEIKCGTSLATG